MSDGYMLRSGDKNKHHSHHYSTLVTKVESEWSTDAETFILTFVDNLRGQTTINLTPEQAEKIARIVEARFDNRIYSVKNVTDDATAIFSGPHAHERAKKYAFSAGLEVKDITAQLAPITRKQLKIT